MHIYIDESGIFRNSSKKDNVVSCVGALAIPTTRKKELFRAFERLVFRWPNDNGEVKGKLLNEVQVNAVVELLKRFEVIFDVTVIDLGVHDEDDITNFKKLSAANLSKSITEQHHETVRKRVAELQEVFGRLSNPLFLQGMLMFDLIPRLLYRMIIYYARRIPQELQWFYWTVDAKEHVKTEFEETWATTLLPIMTHQSAQNPIALAEGGDYRYFERFQERGGPFTEEIEKEIGLQHGDLESIKLGQVIGKNFTFQNSKYNYGLQIVDILTNATQRALNKKLGIDGWGNIGSLMIHGNRGAIQFIHITLNKKAGEKIRTQKNSPYFGVAEVYRKRAKSIWLDRATEERIEKESEEKNRHLSDERERIFAHVREQIRRTSESG